MWLASLIFHCLGHIPLPGFQWLPPSCWSWERKELPNIRNLLWAWSYPHSFPLHRSSLILSKCLISSSFSLFQRAPALSKTGCSCSSDLTFCPHGKRQFSCVPKIDYLLCSEISCSLNTWFNILFNSYDPYTFIVFSTCALTPNLENRLGCWLIDIIGYPQV